MHDQLLPKHMLKPYTHRASLTHCYLYILTIIHVITLLGVLFIKRDGVEPTMVLIILC
jgi:hypothetical protein